MHGYHGNFNDLMRAVKAADTPVCKSHESQIDFLCRYPKRLPNTSLKGLELAHTHTHLPCTLTEEKISGQDILFMLRRPRVDPKLRSTRAQLRLHLTLFSLCMALYL